MSGLSWAASRDPSSPGGGWLYIADVDCLKGLCSITAARQHSMEIPIKKNRTHPYVLDLRVLLLRKDLVILVQSRDHLGQGKND